MGPAKPEKQLRLSFTGMTQSASVTRKRPYARKSKDDSPMKQQRLDDYLLSSTERTGFATDNHTAIPVSVSSSTPSDDDAQARPSELHYDNEPRRSLRLPLGRMIESESSRKQTNGNAMTEALSSYEILSSSKALSLTVSMAHRVDSIPARACLSTVATSQGKDGAVRVSHSELQRLLQWPSPRLIRPVSDAACLSAKTNAYYDTELRKKFDELSWQRLLPVLPDLRPWGFIEEVPQEVIEQVENVGCIFSTINDTGKKTHRQKEYNVWCETHQRVEKLKLAYGSVMALSLFRSKGKAFWNLVVSAAKERSHTCHNSCCDSPCHTTYEDSNMNKSRITCANNVKRFMKDFSTDDALDQARANCSHQPACWPKHVTPFVQKEASQTMIQNQLHGAIVHAGYCKEHSLDFPIHIPRTLPWINANNDPYYDVDRKLRSVRVRKTKGDSETASDSTWRHKTGLEAELSNTFEFGQWFAALHNHIVEIDQGLGIAPVWAGMSGITDPWFEGSKKAIAAGKGHLVDHQDGTLANEKYTMFYGSLVPSKVMPMVNWAGWRQHWQAKDVE